MNDAFSLVKMTWIQDSTWILEGRAFQHIAVGDSLRFTPSDSAFKIIGIETYGKQVNFLEAGLTGRLTAILTNPPRALGIPLVLA